jgi:hypothetical protein
MTKFTRDMFDFDSFADGSKSVKDLLEDAMSHISKIYPIYIMLRYHRGEPLTKEQLRYMDMLSELVSQYDIDITLVVNEQDVQMFKEYDGDKVFKFLVHSCYDSNDELSNNIAKVKNFILKSAASRFGNRNIGWIFLIEEGIRFYKHSKDNEFVECKTADDLLFALGIWQFIATKDSYAEITDENNIGLSGICNVDFCKQSWYGKSIDSQLCTGALLINLSECYRKHIEFDLMNDVLEDVDFNVSMFANGLHVVALCWPIGILQTLQDYRSYRKISNFILNTWAKWGDRIITEILVEKNKLKAVFAEKFDDIIDEFNSTNRHRIVWPKNERLLAEYLAQKKKIH